MSVTGPKHTGESPAKQAFSKPLAATPADSGPVDPDLALATRTWPAPPQAVKAEIVAMVKATGQG